jgi:hypothetical protein
MASRMMPPLGEPKDQNLWRRLFRRLRWPVLIVVILAALAVGGFYGFSVIHGNNNDDNAKAQATPTPGESVTAEQALAAYVQGTLQQPYLGDCSTVVAAATPQPGLCSTERSDRLERKAYLVGANPLQFQKWVFLLRQGNVWAVQSALDVKPDSLSAPGAPWPLEKGAVVIVGGTGTCLNVRVSPSIKADAVDCIADGEKIVLEQGPVEADGFEWWQPQGRSGWVASDWLRYADETAVIPTPLPTATPGM